jgi:hypothetical protein
MACDAKGWPEELQIGGGFFGRIKRNSSNHEQSDVCGEWRRQTGLKWLHVSARA